MSPLTPEDNPIRVAIREKLLENSILEEVGVYYGLAPSGTELPYVLFQEFGDGDPLWTFAGPPLITVPWMVKGVGTAEEAEALDKLCRDTLNRAELSIPGFRNQFCMYTKTMAYNETPDGERYEHRGAIYKITTEEVV